MAAGAGTAPDLAANNPPLSPSPLATGQGSPAEDDGTEDWSYIKTIQNDPSKMETCKANQRDIEKRFPVDVVSIVEGRWLQHMFGTVLTIDEPPNRHLFSALGGVMGIGHVRLNSDSTLRVSVPGTTPELNMGAYRALHVLRERFANKPTGYGQKKGCGTSNCHEANVLLDGDEEWQEALRAIMLAVDLGGLWEEGAALPTTVAIRAPKESPPTGGDLYDDGGAMDSREELGLTLHLAQLGIAPPVFATFPVKKLRLNKTLIERGYGYVVEDKWEDLPKLLRNINDAHKSNPTNRREAHKSVESSVTALLHKVAHNDFLLFDVKPSNMVGRRVGHTLAYEVRMIDFDSRMTVQANMHNESNPTSAKCIFFVNGLLFLNYTLHHDSQFVPAFRNLAREVVDTWRTMRDEPERSFCVTLREDTTMPRLRNYLPSLLRAHERTFPLLLREAFYHLLHLYAGKDGGPFKRTLKADAGPTNVIDRFVDQVAARFGYATAP